MESKPIPARYFLGANAKHGFSSLYDNFVDLEGGDFLWVIKGGPGCGKSSFMKRIGQAAEEHGEAVEYIHCSGDPDSLDGVYLPKKRTAYVDGTAPHVIEATYPGAASLYLDIGSFFDAAALSDDLDEIVRLNHDYKALYDRAYALIAAATALLPKNAGVQFAPELQEKLEKKAMAQAGREFRKLPKEAAVKHRFLSAVSCKGRMMLEDTLRAYEHITALDNELGLAHRYLACLAELAQERGQDCILCHDPLEPEKLEALLLPESGSALIAVDKASALPLTPERHMRLDALGEKLLTNEEKAVLRARRRESRILLQSAVKTLAQAKRLHDELEQVYNPHVDFDGVFSLARDHIHWLWEA